MRLSKRFVIDFQITGFCNLTCPFCCGTSKKILGPSFNDIKKSIIKLKRAGVTTIVLTGGEPLIRPDVVKIIKYIKQLNFEVYLSSNGVLVHKYLKRIEKYIDCLGLPLDGSTASKSRTMGRSLKSYQTTIKLLNFFNKNEPSYNIKVGTVVSKINQKDLFKIGQILFRNKNIYSPHVWRLYQFSPLSFGKESQHKYEISNKNFKQICQKIKKNFPNHNIVPLSNAKSNDAYFFIDPELKIILLTHDRFVEIGDLRTISINFLKKMKNNYNKIANRGSYNRQWLSE